MNRVKLFRTSAGRWSIYRGFMWHLLPHEDRKMVLAQNVERWLGKHSEKPR
jgi:hypothetical protein